jgi:hypothetical protein
MTEYFTADSCYNFPTAGIVKVHFDVFGKGLGQYEWVTP